MQPSSFCEVIFVVIMMVSILRALQAACPPDWLTWQDSCYILLSQKMNWFDAKTACDRPGVSLVFPNSMEEHTFLWEEMSTRMRELGGSADLWINCYRYDDERFNCSGYEGTSNFRNWGSSNPTSSSGEDCARMTSGFGGDWADRYCDENFFVACEMSALAYGCRQPSRRYIHVPQQCLLNHQIKSYPVNESIGCGQAFWAEPLCRSFNLWKQADNKTSCQLNHASLKESDVTDIKYEENCYFYVP